MFVVVPFVRPEVAPSILERSSPWWAYPLFLQNFLVPNSAGAAGPLGVTWSLAIEEQFYLVWPLFVRYCSRKQLLWIALAVICVSPASRLVLRHFDVNLYTNVFSRLDGLMAGAMLAVLARSTTFEPSRLNRPAWFGLTISLVVAFAAESAGARWMAFSFSAVASASLVHLALYSRQAWFHDLLSNRFLVYTGTISYGLYLLHKIPFDAAREVTLAGPPLLYAVLLFSACYVIAAASWNVLEKPFLRLNRRVERHDSSPRLSPSFN
jgi:peptidoglycan/LPS O-acetylase OafA/YrhL